MGCGAAPRLPAVVDVYAEAAAEEPDAQPGAVGGPDLGVECRKMGDFGTASQPRYRRWKGPKRLRGGSSGAWKAAKSQLHLGIKAGLASSAAATKMALSINTLCQTEKRAPEQYLGHMAMNSLPNSKGLWPA